MKAAAEVVSLNAALVIRNFLRVSTGSRRKYTAQAGVLQEPPDDFGASKQAKFNSLPLAQWGYAAGNSSGPLVSGLD